MFSTCFQKQNDLPFHKQKPDLPKWSKCRTKPFTESLDWDFPHGPFSPRPQLSPSRQVLGFSLSFCSCTEVSSRRTLRVGWEGQGDNARLTCCHRPHDWLNLSMCTSLCWLWAEVCSTVSTPEFTALRPYPPHHGPGFLVTIITCPEIWCSSTPQDKLTWQCDHKCHGLRTLQSLQGPPAFAPWLWESGAYPSRQQLQVVFGFLLKDSEEKILLLLATKRHKKLPCYLPVHLTILQVF